MREKAVQAATVIHARLVDEHGPDVPQPWAKVRAAMKTDPAVADLVPHLPRNLGRAVRRARLPRRINGRPRNLPL